MGQGYFVPHDEVYRSVNDGTKGRHGLRQFQKIIRIGISVAPFHKVLSPDYGFLWRNDIPFQVRVQSCQGNVCPDAIFLRIAHKLCCDYIVLLMPDRPG